MGKVQRILALVDEIRELCSDIMSEAPRDVWRDVLDVDDRIDMLKYVAERLQDRYVEIGMNR